MSRAKTRIGLRQAWTALLALAAVLCASVIASPSAFAAAGAIGGIDKPAVVNSEVGASYLACDNDGGREFCNFDITGWAYNAHTKPSQTVQLTMYMGTKLVHTTAQYPAIYPDAAAQKAHNLHTANVGWLYSVDWQDYNWADMYWWTKVCVKAHDKGEAGGWVSLGCVSVHRVKYYLSLD